jgi:hypothetical protein
VSKSYSKAFDRWLCCQPKATLFFDRSIRYAYCNKGVLDISSQRQLYWLNIVYVVAKSHPFLCKYDIDEKKNDQIKISNYSKQQAFG